MRASHIRAQWINGIGSLIKLRTLKLTSAERADCSTWKTARSSSDQVRITDNHVDAGALIGDERDL